MSRTNTIPAFPEKWDAYHTRGMTLRDYFASKAMQGFMAALADPQSRIATKKEANAAKSFAAAAYVIADAMLEERSRE